MTKPSNDDGQFFMVFVGGRQEPASQNDEFASWFMGVVAIAIVTMIFVGLINDAERKRALEQPVQPVSCWYQRGEAWFNRCYPSLSGID